MIYDNENKKAWTYPDHAVDPQIKKSLEWCANAVQFYYRTNGLGNDSTGNLSANLKAFRDKAANNRRYAAGRQSIAQYLPLLGHTKEQIQQNKSHMAVDWRLPQIWLKFRDIITTKMNKVDYSCKASLVDPISLEKRMQAKWEMELQIRMRPIMEEWNKMAGANITGIQPGLPRDLEELDIAFDMNYKEALALAAEKGIDLTLYANDWRELKKKLEEDSIDIDLIACRTYVDSSNAIRLKYIDPTSLMLPLTADREFKHLAIGYVERLTISQIKKMDHYGQISSHEYELMSKARSDARGANIDGPMNNYVQNRGWTGDSSALDVVYFEWPSLDIHRGTKKKDAHGNDRYYKEEFGASKYNAEHQIPMWYGCYWVPATNSYFGWGPVQYMNRLKSQMNDPRSSIHVYSNTWDGATTNAMTERVVPFVNAFSVAWFKFQDEVNRARPSGFWIDIDALNNVVDSQGKSLHPKDNIAAFLRSGVLVVNTRDESGNTTRTPVQELPSSLQSVEPHIQTMMVQIQNIRDVTGLNEFADSSTPNKEISATATNYMVNAAENAIYRCLDACNWLYLGICRGIVSRLQQIVAKGPVKGYIHAMGSSSVEAVSITADLSLADIGLVLENVVTPDEKMWVERQIELALQQRQTNGTGGIELEDALAIRACRSVKMAERMLAIRRKRRKSEDAQRAMEISKQQAQIQADAAIQVEQFKQQTLQTELQVYREKESFLTEELKRRYQYQYMWQNEIQDTKNEGLIASQRVRQGLPSEYEPKETPQ